MEEKRSKFWQTPLGATTADALTFAALNAMQVRRWRDATSPAQLDAYLARHGAMSLDEFHAAPATRRPAPSCRRRTQGRVLTHSQVFPAAIP